MGHYFVRYKREFVITEFDCSRGEKVERAHWGCD